MFSFPLLFLLSILYMIQVTSFNSKSYLIAINQEKIQSLEKNNNNLEIQVSLKAQPNLDKVAKEFAFEKIKKIDYINLFQGVAEK